MKNIIMHKSTIYTRVGNLWAISRSSSILSQTWLDNASLYKDAINNRTMWIYENSSAARILRRSNQNLPLEYFETIFFLSIIILPSS